MNEREYGWGDELLQRHTGTTSEACRDHVGFSNSEKLSFTIKGQVVLQSSQFSHIENS